MPPTKNPAPDPCTDQTDPPFVSRQVTQARRYYLNLNPPVHSPATVVCGGVERCRNDYLVQRKSFPYLAIEFVAAGSGALSLDGRCYQLKPGTAFAYGPKICHSIGNDSRQPMQKYYVDFVGPELRRELRSSSLGKWTPVQVSSLREVVEIFEALHENANARTPFSSPICAHLISMLILKISEKAIPYGSSHTRAFPNYQRVRQYFLENYLELKTVEQAAKACHLDPAYLSRLFQRFDHQSPYQLLMQLKIDRAAELLTSSRLLIKEVAAELNFADPCHFSRVFKKGFGLSPQKFLDQRGPSGINETRKSPDKVRSRKDG